jgi:uncharacterized integral membrane protein
MADDSINYDVTFRDFQFLQSYMARRLFAKNRREYGAALLGIVLCACLIVMAIVITVNPFRVAALLGGSRYPLSVYIAIAVCLATAIVCLIPAVALRLKTLRMQVSDNSPFLGATKLSIEAEGLVVNRKHMRISYQWDAFQGIEITKGAVVLPIDNGIGLIIPAAAFASDAERYGLASAVSKRIEASMNASLT